MIVIAKGQKVPKHVVAIRGEGNTLEVFESFQDLISRFHDHLFGFSYIEAGDLGDKEAYAARFRLASQLITAANSYDPDEVMDLDPEYQMALSNGGRRPAQVDTWEIEDMPLYIQATYYAPYTDVPLPEGNVVAINSHTEEDLVTSLLDGDVLSGVQVEAGTTWEG